MKAMKLPKYKLNLPKQRGVTLAGSLIVFGLVLTFVLRTPAAQAKLQSWKLLPTAEAYTELYFVMPQTIPSQASATPVTFTFRIHNLTGRAVTYPYQILIDGPNGEAAVVLSSSILVTDQNYQDIPESITLPKADQSGRTQVVVWLPNQNQQIDFWLGGTQ
jgi:hypothetical protein